MDNTEGLFSWLVFAILFVAFNLTLALSYKERELHRYLRKQVFDTIKK